MAWVAGTGEDPKGGLRAACTCGSSPSCCWRPVGFPVRPFVANGATLSQPCTTGTGCAPDWEGCTTATGDTMKWGISNSPSPAHMRTRMSVAGPELAGRTAREVWHGGASTRTAYRGHEPQPRRYEWGIVKGKPIAV